MLPPEELRQLQVPLAVPWVVWAVLPEREVSLLRTPPRDPVNEHTPGLLQAGLELVHRGRGGSLPPSSQVSLVGTCLPCAMLALRCGTCLGKYGENWFAGPVPGPTGLSVSSQAPPGLCIL